MIIIKMLYLTIIIPIYNVEKYIVDCLQSIIDQLDDRIEILCIDDGSTDHSIEILKDYLNQQPKSLVKISESINRKILVSVLPGISVFHMQKVHILLSWIQTMYF